MNKKNNEIRKEENNEIRKEEINIHLFIYLYFFN